MEACVRKYVTRARKASTTSQILSTPIPFELYEDPLEATSHAMRMSQMWGIAVDKFKVTG